MPREMSTLSGSRFTHLDGWAIGLSGLCALHCLATAIAVGLLSSFAGLLEAPIIHEGGLILAILLGGLALGNGARTHGMLLPVAVGALGLGIMAGALSLPHGASGEIAYSVLGVLLLALGHELNRRAHW
ncbi:MAG TPA: MerC domain-containing protein [Sphingobium sp.]|nr:MerC domain-containing protein [Sphingobium sp.]